MVILQKGVYNQRWEPNLCNKAKEDDGILTMWLLVCESTEDQQTLTWINEGEDAKTESSVGIKWRMKTASSNPQLDAAPPLCFEGSKVEEGTMKGKEAPPDKDPCLLSRTLHPQKDYPLVCGFVRQRAGEWRENRRQRWSGGRAQRCFFSELDSASLTAQLRWRGGGMFLRTERGWSAVTDGILLP